MRMKPFGVMLFLLLTAAGTAFAKEYRALPEALEALESDNAVTVSTQFVWTALNVNYVFEPRAAEPLAGFIIYPGGLVDARAYAPAARAIAEQGFLAVIVNMPFEIAFLGKNRAAGIMREHPEIELWAIGGHSLGGVVACAYAKDNPDKVDGVVLWAAYPSSSFSIADKDLDVVSIYSTNDGLTTLDEIDDSRDDLPPDTQFVAIEGGNHTYFGWYYGYQGGELQQNDNLADITREQQQQQLIEATTGFLRQL